jgi:hypothetical protein
MGHTSMISIFTDKLSHSEWNSLRTAYTLWFNTIIPSNEVHLELQHKQPEYDPNKMNLHQTQATLLNFVFSSHIESFCQILAVKKKLDPTDKLNQNSDYSNELIFNSDDIAYLNKPTKRPCKNLKARFAIYALERIGVYVRPSVGGFSGFYETCKEVLYAGKHDSSNIEIIPGRYLLFRKSLNSSYPNQIVMCRINIWKTKDASGNDAYRYRSFYLYVQEGLERRRTSEGFIFENQDNAIMYGSVTYTHVESTEYKSKKEKEDERLPTIYPERIDLHIHRGNPSFIRGLQSANYPFLKIPTCTRICMRRLEKNTEDADILSLEKDVMVYESDLFKAENKYQNGDFPGVLGKKEQEIVGNHLELDWDILNNRIETTYSNMLTP